RARAGMEGHVLPHWNGVVLQRMPVGDGFLRRILHHAQTDVVVELIHRHGVVREFARTAALEDGHRQRRFRGDFLGRQQAGPAATDDGDVNGLEIGHESTSLPSPLLIVRSSPHILPRSAGVVEARLDSSGAMLDWHPLPAICSARPPGDNDWTRGMTTMDIRRIGWIKVALAVGLALSGALTASARRPRGVPEPYTPAKDAKDLT